MIIKRKKKKKKKRTPKNQTNKQTNKLTSKRPWSKTIKLWKFETLSITWQWHNDIAFSQIELCLIDFILFCHAYHLKNIIQLHVNKLNTVKFKGYPWMTLILVPLKRAYSQGSFCCMQGPRKDLKSGGNFFGAITQARTGASVWEGMWFPQKLDFFSDDVGHDVIVIFNLPWKSTCKISVK